MSSPATPFDFEATGKMRPVIRRNPEDPSKIELVEAMRGTDPRFNTGASVPSIWSATRSFPTRQRRLIPLSEFHMKVGDDRYRVALDDGDHFYRAGTWGAAVANDDLLSMPHDRMFEIVDRNAKRRQAGFAH